MAITIGRLGYLGLGIESTPSTPVSPSIFLQYTDISMRGHHEAIEITSNKGTRFSDKDSVVGKKWSEGDISINADVISAGYFWKMALGNELLATGTPNSHTFYVTASGNTPKTATLVFGRDTDVEQYESVAIDELNLEVSDGLVTMTAAVMGEFPTVGASQTFTATSGTHFSFKDMAVKFGSDLTAAAAAQATPVNELTLTVANNVETIHRSGDSNVSTIRMKQARVTGSYTVYFENETDKNAYYNLQKRAMEVTFTGNANEQMRIRIPRFRLSEGEVTTGLDDFFAVNCEFVAEDVVDSGVRLIDVRLQNNKATAY